MKSIMEQASSIIKAIEKAWIAAENPKEFSIKIFEKEERNFFGMTTKPAKIGIFFEDAPHPHHDKTQKPRIEKKETPAVKPTPNKPAHKVNNAPQVNTAPEKNKNNSSAQKPASPEKTIARPTTSWNEPLIQAASSWINKTLSLVGMRDIEFSTEQTGKILKLTFNRPLIENPVIEKQLFRSIAHLVISSLRNQYKQEIKDLKIVLIRP